MSNSSSFPLGITSRQRALDTRVTAVAGDIDAANVSILAEALAATPPNVQLLIVDLRNVTLLSAAAVGALAAAHRNLSKRTPPCRLAIAASGLPAAVIELCDLGHLILTDPGPKPELNPPDVDRSRAFPSSAA